MEKRRGRPKKFPDGPERQNNLTDAEINAMVVSHLGLIKREAKFLVSYSHDLSLSDLINVGVIGAIEAGRKFKPEKNYRFFTYAVHYVRRSMRLAIMNEGRNIRLPNHVYEGLRKIRACEKDLGRKPTVEEIHEMTDISEASIENALRAKRIGVSSLEKGVTSSSDDSRTLLDVLEDQDAESPIIHCLETSEIELTRELLDILDKKDARTSMVLRLRFGIDSGSEMTLQEIGNQMGVTRERIRQISDNGLKKLKQIYRERISEHRYELNFALSS
jgi:RNA polymerase sigma factor (sigma-70 family)